MRAARLAVCPSTVLWGVMLLIGLILLNSVVKKGVAPLTALAQAMVFVVKGQWSEIHLEKRWKRRRDEVGQICRAFETMVHDLEEGGEGARSFA